MALLRRGEVIQNEVERTRRYRVLDPLGKGGFGEAYKVVELDEHDNENGSSCLKITTDADAWHGEAYFGALLRNDAHVVRTYDAFPVILGAGNAARMRFCIDMELIEGGTVLDACARGELPWPEKRILRQLSLLLRPLSLLHERGVSHRDINPGNVFMGSRNVLKLGDFGITKMSIRPTGVLADLYHPRYRPPSLGQRWVPSDDIYQVGLLAMTLRSGWPCDNTTGQVAVNQRFSRGPLRDAVKQAIQTNRRQRFPDAGSMITALD